MRRVRECLYDKVSTQGSRVPSARQLSDSWPLHLCFYYLMTTEETSSDSETKSSPEGSTAATSAMVQEAPAERPEVQALRHAKEADEEVEGRVIGWNRGGFHVVVGELTAFCPRSEMEVGQPRSPKEYLDNTYLFKVLKIQKRGRRVVLSRAAALKSERARARAQLRKLLTVGAELPGTVTSLTDFGAFVDLGGVQGLVHVSEISHRRIERPEDALQVGQEVMVKILKVEKGGKRVSLSMRALEPNPWREIKERYPEGRILKGKVDSVSRHGAFIELEPGLTGLLPTSAMTLPRDASVARAFPPGREVSVQVVAVDERRQRISLAPEGSALEGTRRDYQAYMRGQAGDSRQGFHALADALKKARDQVE